MALEVLVILTLALVVWFVYIMPNVFPSLKEGRSPPQITPGKVVRIPPFPQWDDDYTSAYDGRTSSTYLKDDGFYYHLSQTQNLDYPDDGTWDIMLTRSKTPGAKQTVIWEKRRMDKRYVDYQWNRWYVGLNSELQAEGELES